MPTPSAAPAPAAPERPVASVRFLLRDSAVYGLSNALVKLSALVVVPIMTRALSQAEYGATDALAVLLALLVALSTLGQDSAVARFFYDTESAEDRQQVVTQGLVVQLAMCLVVGAAAIVLGPRILRTPMGTAYQPAYHLVIAVLPFVLLFQFWRGLLKWMLARTQFVILSVGTAAANMALVAALAITDALTVRSFFVAMLAANVASAALGLHFCRAYLTWPQGFAFVGPMLRFGGPYAAVLLVGTLLPAFDRAVITTRLGLVPLAEYAVGLKYASLLLFPVTAFQTAWGPFCFATFRDPGASEVYSRVLTLFAAGLALTCFGLVALAEPLIRAFASPAYVSAAPLVVPVVFGLALEACSWVLGIGIDLAKRSELSLLSYLIGLGISVAGVLLLVGPYGILGVAAGISLGRLGQSIAYSVFGMRVYPLRVRWRKPLATLAAALVMSVAAVGLSTASVPLTIAVRAAAGAILLLVIVAGLGPEERVQLARLRGRLGMRGAS